MSGRAAPARLMLPTTANPCWPCHIRRRFPTSAKSALAHALPHVRPCSARSPYAADYGQSMLALPHPPPLSNVGQVSSGPCFAPCPAVQRPLALCCRLRPIHAALARSAAGFQRRPSQLWPMLCPMSGRAAPARLMLPTTANPCWPCHIRRRFPTSAKSALAHALPHVRPCSARSPYAAAYGQSMLPLPDPPPVSNVGQVSSGPCFAPCPAVQRPLALCCRLRPIHAALARSAAGFQRRPSQLWPMLCPISGRAAPARLMLPPTANPCCPCPIRRRFPTSAKSALARALPHVRPCSARSPYAAAYGQSMLPLPDPPPVSNVGQVSSGPCFAPSPAVQRPLALCCRLRPIHA